jgi:hypothetical protein
MKSTIFKNLVSGGFGAASFGRELQQGLLHAEHLLQQTQSAGNNFTFLCPPDFHGICPSPGDDN